jgi:hypothetical protein
LHAGQHYDALAVAAFEGAPEQLDAISVPTSGPRTDMVMQVDGWTRVERLSMCFLAPNFLHELPLRLLSRALSSACQACRAQSS